MLDRSILCWLAGGAVSLVVGLTLARRERLPLLRTMLGLLLMGVAVGVGAHVHALVLEEGRRWTTLLTTPGAWAGGAMRLPGGLLLATALGPLVAALLGLSYWRFSDVAVTSGAALLAVGRIGCHLAGCCFGTPSTLPWSISYPKGSAPYAAHWNARLLDAHASESLRVHPFALYLVLAAAAVLLALLWLRARGARPGVQTFVGIASLGLAFGSIESVRDVSVTTPEMLRQELWLLLGATAIVAGAIAALIARHRDGRPLLGDRVGLAAPRPALRSR